MKSICNSDFLDEIYKFIIFSKVVLFNVRLIKMFNYSYSSELLLVIQIIFPLFRFNTCIFKIVQKNEEKKVMCSE